MSRTFGYGEKGTTRFEEWRKGLLYAGVFITMLLLAVLTTSSGWASAQVDCADLASLRGQANNKVGSIAPDCSPNLEIVSSPNMGPDNSRLSAIDGVGANDIWAVGTYGNNTNDRTLIEHWNGATWSVVPSPNADPGYHNLAAVDAISANDVWAVGNYFTAGTSKTLILHWNGTTWSIIPSPNVGTSSNMLKGVSGTSANDVWAVGEYYSGSANQTLVLHWNGTLWSVVASPNVGASSNSLSGVSAGASNDVWAVGNYFNGSVNRTLAMRWNGASWTVAASPSVGTEDNFLYEVSYGTANNVWAVGFYRSFGTSRTLTLHYDGAVWNSVPSPNNGTEGNSLSGVDVIGNNAWAVGAYGTVNAQTLVLYWTGSGWNIVPSPNGSLSTNSLSAVLALAADNMWAVGQYLSGTDNLTLVERYSPCCALAFTDVAPGSTFHPYVQCMACEGIINGYVSGCETGNPCFRPNTNVTRGQLAKIVSSAAGFAEPVGAQQYEDVAPGSTFYDFVWRLSSRGFINGYPCGGLGEPCMPGNRPYYRPNANVTRGQTAKIVATAKNLPAPPGSQRTFEDVPIGSTFWQWIESLSTAGAISGYACGGVGEPCTPGNRPYFRPGNSVTRGQSSKIVSLTFFPSCTAR